MTKKRQPITEESLAPLFNGDGFTDDQIAAQLRREAGMVNHWLHVATHHGLFVQLGITAGDGKAPPRISDVCVMRPIVPTASPETPR